MILELAILNVIPEREAEFEDAFRHAQRIISTWKQLLHHFYDPFPAVEHYTAVSGVPE